MLDVFNRRATKRTGPAARQRRRETFNTSLLGPARVTLPPLTSEAPEGFQNLPAMVRAEQSSAAPHAL
jgi:hypothetical protein